MNRTFRDLIPWNKDRKNSAQTLAGLSDNPFLSLQRDLNRVFDNFWQDSGLLSEADFNAMMPRTDVAESDKEIEISIELPGMSEKDLDITINDDCLTIHGEKKAEEKKSERKDVWMSERSYGVIHRSFALPDGVDSSKAEASFKDGVLKVKMPKTAEAQAQIRHIAINKA